MFCMVIDKKHKNKSMFVDMTILVINQLKKSYQILHPKHMKFVKNMYKKYTKKVEKATKKFADETSAV